MNIKAFETLEACRLTTVKLEINNRKIYGKSINIFKQNNMHVGGEVCTGYIQIELLSINFHGT